jgi:hypothetical protein
MIAGKAKSRGDFNRSGFFVFLTIWAVSSDGIN